MTSGTVLCSCVVVDDDDDEKEEEEEEQKNDGNDDDDNDDDNVRENFVKCTFLCRSLKFYSFFQSATIDVLKTYRVLRSVSTATEEHGAKVEQQLARKRRNRRQEKRANLPIVHAMCFKPRVLSLDLDFSTDI